MWTRLLVACLVVLGLLPVVVARTGAQAAAPIQAHQGQFFPLTPARVLNTSTGLGVVGGVSGTIGAGATKNVNVLGAGGVPSSGVSAVVLSLSVVSPSTTTAETVWPAGATRPTISSLSAPHAQVTGTVTSALGTSGQISIYNSAGTATLYGDVVGYYTDGTATTAGSTYVPVTQSRILDTAAGVGHTGKIASNSSFDLTVTGTGGVPSSGITAVAVVLTAVKPSATELFTVYPTGVTRPSTLTLSTTSNVEISTTVVSAVSSAGQITIYNSTGSTDLYGDVVGYWQALTATAQGSAYSAVTPTRIMSTTTALGAGATLNLTVNGTAGVPSTGVSAVWLYLTAVAPSAANTVTQYPTGSTRPTTATVTSTTNITRTNLVAAVPGTNGQITIYNSAGNTNLYVDVIGYTATALAPATPAAPTANPGSQQASVSWAPPNDNGAAIISYLLTATPGGATATIDGALTTGTVTGLTNGTTYTFTVKATNAAGSSPASPASAAVLVAGSPASPTNVSAVAGDARAVVSWTAPANTGGIALTGYTVTSSPGGVTATAGASASSATVTGLTNGTAYTFTVHATNSVASSAESTPSSAVTPAGPPGAPTNVTATASSESAVISWTAPPNGGSPLTSYIVAATPGGSTVSAGASDTTATMTSLTNGTAYTFTVTASNSAGSGPASSPSNSVTPQAFPGDVTTAISTGSVTSVAGSGAAATSAGTGSSASFNTPRGVVVVGGVAYVADRESVSTVDLSTGQVSILAGSASSTGCTDASTGSAARISGAKDMATDGYYGYLVDGCGLRRVSLSTGAVSTMVSGSGYQGVTVGPDGFLYVTQTIPQGGTTAATLYRVNPANNQTTSLKTAYPGAYYGVAADSSNVYFVQYPTQIAKYNLASGTTTTLVSDSSLDYASDLESAGNYLYTGASGALKRYAKADGTSRTVAGPGAADTDGTGANAGFSSGPTDIASDGTTLFVVDGGNRLRAVSTPPLPGPPINVSAAPGNMQAVVSWSPPTNNGSGPIIGYTVLASPGGATTTTSGTTTATITGLTNGTSYTFTVTATTAEGTGPASGTSAPVTPAGSPAAPTSVNATPGNAQATVSWSPPPSDGGSPITGYTVLASPGGATSTTTGATTATVSGLTNGISYTFTVTAANAAGSSPSSAPSAPITPIGPPDRPTNVAAAATDGQVAVSWTAPANSGGSPITGYTITASPGGATVTTSGATSATVTGLSNGTAYTFTVTATNAIGTSAASAPSAPVTPNSPPNPPTNVHATAGDTTATVNWTAPANSNAVTGYTVTASPGGQSANTTGATTVQVGGLTNGITYTFTVVSNSDVGPSIASDPSDPVTPIAHPGSVQQMSVTQTLNNTLDMSWTPPTTGPITSYIISATPGNISRTVGGNAIAASLGGLTVGVQYTVSVTAQNSVGTGPSASRTAQPISTLAVKAYTDVAWANGFSKAISDDGRYIAYTWSPLENGSDINEGWYSVYLRDTKALVTYSIGGVAKTNADARWQVSMSGDGRYIVFNTSASLIPSDTNGHDDVYLYDRQDDSLRIVSTNAQGVPGNGANNNAVISADGSTVAFESSATNLGPSAPGGGSYEVYTKNLASGAVQMVAGDFNWLVQGPPAISGDGSLVAFDASVSFVSICPAPNNQTLSVNETFVGHPGGVATLVSQAARTTCGGSTSLGLQPAYSGSHLESMDRGGLIAYQASDSPGYGQQIDAAIPSNGSDDYVDTNMITVYPGNPNQAAYYGNGAHLSPDGTLFTFNVNQSLFMGWEPGSTQVPTQVVVGGSWLWYGYQDGIFAADDHTLLYTWNNEGYSGKYNHAYVSYIDPRANAKSRRNAGWRESVNTATGSYISQANDISVANAGPSLGIQRTYSSDNTADGPFGTGFTFNYGMTLTGAPAGDNNPAYTLTYGDGRQLTFTGDGNGGYNPIDGFTDHLTNDASGGGHTLTQKDGETFDFGVDGNLDTITDANGRSLSLAYTNGQLATVTSTSSGRSLSFTWQDGHISSVSTNAVASFGGPLTWTYNYTGAMLTSVCQPTQPGDAPACTAYGYTGNRLAGVTNANGDTDLNIDYYDDGRVHDVGDGTGNNATFTYTGTQQVTITDKRGNTTTHNYNANMQLTSEVNPYGKIRRYTYDSHGYRTSVTDENGNTITTTYNANGDQTSYDDGAHDVSYDTYDANDNLAVVRDARSSSPTDNTYATNYSYDSHHNLTSQTLPAAAAYPNGLTTIWTYSSGSESACDGGTIPAGLILTQRDARQKTTTYTYTHAGDVCTVTTPLGQVTHNSYDEIGRLKTSTVTSDSYPAGTTTTYTYDAAGQLRTETDPETTDAVTGASHQRRVTYTYNDAEQLTQMTSADIDGADPARSTTYSEDRWGHLTSTTDSQTNASVVRSYDENGNLATVTDQLGHNYRISYDKNNLPTTTVLTNYTDPTDPNYTAPRAVTLITNTYDDAGRLITRTDADGRTTRYSYDAANRPTERTLLGYHNRDGSLHDLVVSAETYDPAGNITDTYRGDSKRHIHNIYDADNRLTSSTLDPSGLNRDTTYSYNETGQPTRVTTTQVSEATAQDTQSTTVHLDYNDDGEATSRTVDLPTGSLTTTYNYDTRGLLHTLTDPRGNASGTDPADFTTTYSYDQLGQLTTTTTPPVTVENNGSPSTEQPTTLTGYDTFGDTAHTQDADGNITSNVYDRIGRLSQTTYPTYTRPDNTVLHPTANYLYDDAGNLLTVTNTRRFTTTYAYDAVNRLVAQTNPPIGTDPAGVTIYGYDDAGNRTSVIDPTGATTQYSYDDLNRVRTTDQVVRQPNGPATHDITTTDYDPLGDLVYRQDPAGDTATASYDAAADMRTRTDAANKTWTYAYDLADQPSKVTDPLGRYTTYTYDNAERLRAADSFDTNNTQVRALSATYDDAGNLATTVDGNGHTTTYSYDALNRLLTTTVPVDGSTFITSGYGYDANGNRTRTTDGRGYSSDGTATKLGGTGYDTLLSYTPSGQIATLTEPPTDAYPDAPDRTWTYGYDAGGLLTDETQPGDVTVTHTYDALGRDYADTGTTGDGTVTRGFGYDLDGRLTSFTTPGDDQTVTYDDRGLPVSSTGPDGDTTTDYNDNGQPTTITDPAGTSTFTYNSRGLLRTADEPTTGTTLTYNYDDAGQPSSTIATHGADTSTRTFTFDALGRLTDDQLTAAGTTTADLGYGYDPAGNLTSQTVTAPGNPAAGTSTYGYDQSNRLTSWTAPDTTTTTYGYDPAGNRTQASSDTYTYDAQNRLVTGPNTTYTYTPRGTLATATTNGTTVTDTFDAFNRLTASGDQTYSYDALDRLAGINDTALTYGGFNSQPATSGTTSYSRDPRGNLLATTAGGSNYLAATNVHGDLSYLYNADGTVAGSQVLDPAGKLIGTAGAAPTVADQAQIADPATGNVWMNARWYDPTSATFTSQDTILGTASSPLSLNRYAYGQDNPVTNSDPSGNCPVNATGWGDCSQDRGPRSFSVSAVIGVVVTPNDLLKHTLAPSAPPGMGGGGGCADPNDPNAGDLAFMCAYQASSDMAAALGSFVDAAVAQPLSQLATTITNPSQWGGALTGMFIKPVGQCFHGDLTACAMTALNVATIVPGIGAAARLGVDLAVRAGAEATIRGVVDSEAASVLGAVSTEAVGTVDAAAIEDLTGQALGDGALGAEQAIAASASEAATENAAGSGVAQELAGVRAEDVIAEAESILKDAAESCSVNSFTADTPVLLADGRQIPISKVKPGMKVVATDPATGATANRKVDAVIVHSGEHTMVDLTFADGTTITATDHHPFWDVTTGEFTYAIDLKAGDQVLEADGELLTISKTRSYTADLTAYNLTVDGIHTYYAGATPVLVHNSCAAGDTGGALSGIRNGHLAGDIHPTTGVPFDDSGYPDFSNWTHPDVPDVTIEPTGTRAGDYAAANQAAGLDSTPEGYTWHHAQEPGVMQLVDRGVHAATGHTGGYSIWGTLP